MQGCGGDGWTMCWRFHTPTEGIIIYHSVANHRYNRFSNFFIFKGSFIYIFMKLLLKN